MTADDSISAVIRQDWVRLRVDVKEKVDKILIKKRVFSKNEDDIKADPGHEDHPSTTITGSAERIGVS